MIVEAAVLVVGDHEQRRGPDFRVRCERVVNGLDQRLAGMERTCIRGIVGVLTVRIFSEVIRLDKDIFRQAVGGNVIRKVVVVVAEFSAD